MKRKQILSLVLAISLAPAPFLAGNVNAAAEFNDIANSYAKDAIQQLADAGILNGAGNGQFYPMGNISRQDFAIILVKSLNLDLEDTPATPTFSDVPSTHYSYKYVEAAVKAGLITGTGNGSFGFGNNVTREQMAVLFARSLGQDTTGYGEKLTFADSDKISAWAKDAVGYAVETELISGLPSNSFNPTGLADRQQVALVTSKFLKAQTLKHEEGGKEEKPTVDEPATSVPEPVTVTPSTSSSSSSSRDRTAPKVNIEQFEYEVNEAGTSIRIWGDDGAISEGSATILAYPWTDENENQAVDVSELREAIELGTSDSTGAVAGTQIAELAPGTYRFVITAEDRKGNESAKDSAHVLTVLVESSVTPDTTAPLVDVSKFGPLDNYMGTPDRLLGAAGAISEAGASIKTYRWYDENSNSIVDSNELMTAISLGSSAEDGSVAAASIGDLPAGEGYRFVVTATDAAGNESDKDAAHAVTFALTKGQLVESRPTVTSSVYGFESEGMTVDSYVVYPNIENYETRLVYTPGEPFVNGVVEITLQGMTFDEEDVYRINGGEEWISIGAEGPTALIALDGTDTLTIALRTKTYETLGPNLITFRADADGTDGASVTWSDTQQIIVDVLPLPLP